MDFMPMGTTTCMQNEFRKSYLKVEVDRTWSFKRTKRILCAIRDFSSYCYSIKSK
ncbi:MAG: hypothetical protein V8Q71_03880 [Bacilli bacterium]